MTTESEKLIDAVVRLIKGTQEGKISWTVKKQTVFPSIEPEENEPNIVYEAEYRNRRLRLFEVNNQFSAGRRTMLKIIDDSGTTLWLFPEISGLDDLLSSVRYQTADVKKFLDDIIGDGELELEHKEMSHSR
ncbi:MAG TPA: hypothetical protein VN687_05420 [Blastocatellia bacterium]|nr:hypothetical protein [Blastocatellia bacterium]